MIKQDPLVSIEIEADANLLMERFENSGRVQSVAVSTRADGTLEISSSGKLPRSSLHQLRQVRKSLHAIATATNKDVVIEHGGKELARVETRSVATPKLVIRWWTLLVQVLLGK